MDPHATRNVGHAVLLSTLLGAAYGASYGLVNRSSAILFAGTTGTSAFLGTSIFFGIREWAISPLLVSAIPTGQFAARRAALHPLPTPTPTPADGPSESWAELRMYKVPDSAAAGALTGGSLNILRRGRAGILPGALTVALAASVLQYLANAAHVWRIQYIAREIKAGRGDPTSASKSTTPRGFSEFILDGLGYVMPVKRVSDGEFVRVTEARRAAIAERLGNIHRELVDLEEADRAQSQSEQ